ncbi:hypothetical protein Pmani_035113 [Petrolisthes manimaculis]|uniref:Uncharacterized protein n=1 Tax=Petrolisthes manimaculis TaxID=1843537 RepID=A0AAE1TP01_9EUCA|nr:hypothetical protein Pmani_035113 [Petrolisthes manimaculis]
MFPDLPSCPGSRLGAGEKAPYLLTLLSLFEMLAKLVVSVVSDQGWLERRYIYMAGAVSSAVASFFMTISSSVVGIGVCCGLYGFSAGTIMSIGPVLLVEYLGIEVLPYSYGLLLFFNGVAASFFLPLTGK